MKPFIIIACIMAFVSCTKTDVIHEQITQENELALNRPNRIIFDSSEISLSEYNAVIFDTCTNENILLSGLETYKLKQSPDMDPYYIYYEIDLTGINGIGEISGRKYHGGGKVIGRQRITKNRSMGRTSYRVKYKSRDGHELTFFQRGRFLQIRDKVMIEFNTGFIQSCK